MKVNNEYLVNCHLNWSNLEGEENVKAMSWPSLENKKNGKIEQVYNFPEDRHSN
jgi:hypothetical protein